MQCIVMDSGTRNTEVAMELDQWIAIYTAASQSAANRERSFWVTFTGGLVASSLLVAIIAFVVALNSTSFGQTFGIGAAALGLAMCLIWFALQYRLLYECQHWSRLLRSVESQFAGAELHRSFERLQSGDSFCIPKAAWMCGEWNADAAHFPLLLRALPRVMTLWIPLLFLAAFVAFVVGISLHT